MSLTIKRKQHSGETYENNLALLASAGKTPEFKFTTENR